MARAASPRSAVRDRGLGGARREARADSPRGGTLPPAALPGLRGAAGRRGAGAVRRGNADAARAGGFVRRGRPGDLFRRGAPRPRDGKGGSCDQRGPMGQLFRARAALRIGRRKLAGDRRHAAAVLLPLPAAARDPFSGGRREGERFSRRITSMQTIPNELLDNLLENYQTPADIIGENGLLKQLTKALIERALQTEMNTHLGHKKNEVITNTAGNARNGKSKNAPTFGVFRGPEEMSRSERPAVCDRGKVLGRLGCDEIRSFHEGTVTNGSARQVACCSNTLLLSLFASLTKVLP